MYAGYYTYHACYKNQDCGVDVYSWTPAIPFYFVDDTQLQSTGCPDGKCGVSGVDPGSGNRFEVIPVSAGGNSSPTGNDLPGGGANSTGDGAHTDGEQPLSLTITYNSQASRLSMWEDHMSVGLGMSHNYQRRVTRVMGTSVTGPLDWTYVQRPEGRVERFTNVSGVWQSRPGVEAALVKSSDPSAQIQWIRTDPSGEIENYDTDGRLVSIAIRAGLVQTLEYDSVGHLQSVTDARGRSLIFTYNSNRQIQRIDFPDGQWTTLSFNADGALVNLVRSDGSSREFRYGESGYVISSDHNLVSHLTGIIDEAGKRIVSTWYDDAGRATRTQGANGVGNTTFAYTLSGYQVTSTTITHPLGGIEVRTFQQIAGVNRTTSQTFSCSGCVTRANARTYDSEGRADVFTDFESNVTDFDFDSAGLLTQLVSADGTAIERTTTVQWDSALRVPTQVDIAGQRVNYIYNSRGQPTQIKVTDTATNAYRTATLAYCEQAQVDTGACPLVGLLTAVNGPRLDVTDLTLYTYRPYDHGGCPANPTTCPYRKGDLWKVTSPTANSVTQVREYVARDGAGRLTSIKDPNGVVTDLVYSTRGLLTNVKVRGADNSSEMDDAITQIDYTSSGLVDKITRPDGVFLKFGFDDAHRLTWIEDELQNRVAYSLDEEGNRLVDQWEEYNSAGNVVRRQLTRIFDDLGQLKSVVDGETGVTDLFYDDNGEISKITDALSHDATATVDALGRITQTVANATGVGAETAVSGFLYDSRDNLTKVADPNGLETNYSFNGFDDLTQLTNPDTGTATYGFDGAGNRTSALDARGVATGYSYDALNRLIGINLPTDTDIAFAYDTPESDCLTGETFGTGRLAKITDGSGSTRYCFDRQGRVVRKVQTVTGGSTLTVGSTYDGAGNLVAMTYPSGAVVTYLRDANGRIVDVKATPTATAAQVTIIDDVTYAPFGPITSIKYGNLRTQNRTYDQNYGIDAISESNGSGGFIAEYDLDANGNLIGVNERGTLDRDYEYDGQDRLKAMKNAATGATIEAYEYDATGNRTKKTVGATAYNYTYVNSTPSHRLTNISNNGTRTYDANGNTTAIAGNVLLTYNDSSRLKTVTLNGTLVRTYLYNGKGERVHRTVHSGSMPTVQFVYDEAGHLLGEYMASGSRVVEYVWMDDRVVGTLRSHDGTTYQYVQTDHLGTPRAVINPANNVVIWRWDLTASGFGDLGTNTDPDGNAIAFSFNLRFPGQYYDGIENINYNYFRDYDSKTGRYLESDPIGLAGGMTTYGYAFGSPTNNIDPRGLRPPTPWETGVIRGAFGPCLLTSGIDIGESATGGAWSPRGGRVRFPPDYFDGGDSDNSLLTAHENDLVHEVFHTWQRTRGAHVSMAMWGPQWVAPLAGKPGRSELYEYFPPASGNVKAALEYFDQLFEQGLYESQAQMYQEAYANRNSNRRAKHLWKALGKKVSDQTCGCQ
jgi:RHS repeat-associated protein